jgi:hypothetical protein
MKKILALAGFIAPVLMGIKANAAPDTAFVTPIFITQSVNINSCDPGDSVEVIYGFINHGPYTLQTTDTFAFNDFTTDNPDPTQASNIWVTNPSAPVPPGDTFALDYNTFYTGTSSSVSLPIGWLIDSTGTAVMPPFANGSYFAATQWLGFITTASGSIDFRTDLISNNQDSTSDYADSTIGVMSVVISCPTKINNVVKSKTALTIFPNPTTDKISFTNNFTEATDATVQITDIAGRVMKSVDLGKQAPGSKTFSVDVENLTSGMYYIQLVTNSTKSINKFIKN